MVFKKQRLRNRIFGKNWKMNWKMVSRKKSTHWTLGYDGSLHPLSCKAYSYPKLWDLMHGANSSAASLPFQDTNHVIPALFSYQKTITSYPRNFSHLHHLAVAVPNDRDQNEHQCYLKEIDEGKKRKACCWTPWASISLIHKYLLHIHFGYNLPPRKVSIWIRFLRIVVHLNSFHLVQYE